MGIPSIPTTGVYNNLQHSLLKEDEIWTVISKKDLITDEWASQFKSFLHASHKIIDFTQTSSSTEFPHEELSLLGWASLNGHTTIVELIIEHAPLSQDIINQQMTKNITPLGLACEQGHAEIAVVLLNAGAKLDSLDTDGCQPLGLAAHHGHTSTVQAILEHSSCKSDLSACIDAPNTPQEKTALYLACGEGHDEIVTLLLNAGARLDCLTKSRYQPLAIAAFKGHTKTAKAILKHTNFKSNPSYIDTLNGPQKKTALYLACEQGHAKMVKLLLDMGARLDCLTANGNRPLAIATYCGHTNTVQAILEHSSFKSDSSHMEAPNGPYQDTALHIACTKGHDEVVRLLLNEGAMLDCLTAHDYRPLGLATGYGHTRTVHAILEHPSFKSDSSSHIDAPNSSFNETALHLACEQGYAEIVTLLLNKGAKLDSLTNGCKPLDLATYCGHTSTVQAILQHPSFNSDLSSLIDASNTALQIACGQGHAEIVTLLLSAGAQLNCFTQNGLLPLSIAAELGHTSTVQAILEHSSFKSDQSFLIDAPNGTNKETALYIACGQGHTKIVRLLLEKGAKLDYLTTRGSRSLAVATYNGHTSTVQAILEHPSFTSDPSHINALSYFQEEGTLYAVTALHVACKEGHGEIAKLLLDAGAKLDSLTCLTNGYRPLGLATYCGHTTTVQAILEHPSFTSDPSHIDASNGSNKTTALQIACEQGHGAMMTLLLNAGASLFCTTRNGLSAFEIAQRHSNLSHIIFFHLTGGEGNVEPFVSELDKELASLTKRIQNQEAIDLKQLFKSIQSAYGVCLAINMPQPPLILPSLVTSLKKLLKQDRFCSTLQNQVKQLESSRGKTNANLEKVLENALLFKNQLLDLYNIITNLIQNRSKRETFMNNIKILNNQLDNIMQKARNTLATSKLQTLDGFQSQFKDADVFSLLTEWNIRVAHVAASNQMASSSAASSQGTTVVNLNPMESIANHLGIEGGQDLWACGLMEGQDLRAIGIDLDIKYYCEQWPHRRTDSDFIAEMTGLLKNKTLLWDAILGANNISSVAAFITQLESGAEELDTSHLIQAYKNNSLSLLIAFLSKKETIKKNLNTNFKDLSLSEISIQTTWIPLELYQHLTAKQTDNPSKRQKR